MGQGVLRAGVSLLRGLLVQFNRVAKIPLQDLAFLIELGQPILRCSIALLGGMIVKLQCFFVVLLYRESDPIYLSQLILCARISLLRHRANMFKVFRRMALDLRCIRLLSLPNR